MHFIHSFCNGNCMATDEEYWRYPNCRTQHYKTFKTIHSILRKMGSFAQPGIKHEQPHCENNVMFWQHTATKPKYKHTHNFQDDWCSTDTGMENSIQWLLPSVSPTEHNTFHLEIMRTVVDFVNGCNKCYKFCLIFYSRVTLNLARMYYQHKDDIKAQQVAGWIQYDGGHSDLVL